MVIVNFIRDPEVGIFARAKRVAVGSSTVAPPSTYGGGNNKVVKGREEGEESDKSE